MALWIFTGDGVVGYVAVDLYWGRCASILGNGAIDSTENTEWSGMAL